MSTIRSSAAGSQTAVVPASPWLDPAGGPSASAAATRTRRGARHAFPVVAVVLMAVAAVLAWAFREIGDQPIMYDADNYLVHARILAFESIQTWGFRTYGYPAFLVPWVALFSRDQALVLWGVFVTQLVVHLAASWYFARCIGEAFENQTLGRLTFAIVLLNPFLLIMTGQVLSDHLSTALVAVAVGLLLPTRHDLRAGVLRAGMVALFTLTLAVEVRPANAILLPICALLWTIRWWTVARADVRRWVGGIALVGVIAALPFIPQVVINWRAHRSFSPLVVNSLYEQQMVWGAQNLKYATFALRDHPGASAIFYQSPFASNQSSLAGLAMVNPLGVVATLGLHLFGLFDQDFPFPYVTVLDAWHRWPLAIAGYLFLWATGLGLVVAWKHWWRPGTRLTWNSLLLTSAAYLLIYIPTVVECRFILPLYVLLAPVAAVAVLRVGAWVRARAWTAVALSLVTLLLTVGASVWLSGWVQSQASALVLTRAILQAPATYLPVARFESPPDRWIVEQRRKYVVRAVNLGEQKWRTQAPGKVFLRIRWIGPGAAQTSDARVELRPAISQEVQPGGQLDLEATVTAPRNPGEYRIGYQLELEEFPDKVAGQPFDSPVTVVTRRDGRR